MLNPVTTKAEAAASGVRMTPVVIVPTNVKNVMAPVGSMKLTSDEPNGAKSSDNKGRGCRKWGQYDAGGDCTYERKKVRGLVR